jgi:transposase InsO family protein
LSIWALILNAFSRKVVGWALDRTLANRLTISALEHAIAQRRCTQENKNQKTGWRRGLDSNLTVEFHENFTLHWRQNVDISSEPWPREKEEEHRKLILRSFAEEQHLIW